MESEDKNKRSQDKLILEHEAKVVSGLLESKEKYRKIVNAGITRWVQDFQDGRIEVNTVDDLKKLIEIDLELQKHDF